MRVLVTGGAGAIGSHLVEALMARGDQAAVLDSFHEFYPRELKERNLASASAHPAFCGIYELDIRDRDRVRSCLDRFKPEGVVHLAARAGVRPSVTEAVEYSDVNQNGTAVMLTEAVRASAGRFVFASSSSVYGARVCGACGEDADANHPISPYGATKRAGELFCHAIHKTEGLSVACLRFFSVYGPRQRPDLAVDKFARLMLAGREIPVFGDGQIERDFTFISDIVAGILGALDRIDGFRIFNLGRGRPISVNQMIETLERELGVSAKRRTLPPHPADVPRTWASIELAERELGYAPEVHFEDGIRAYIRWLREQN